MQRAIGLRGAVAINVITMIGIGPLVTIPLVLAALGGSLALVAWIAGAIVALCDGLVWAELSSRYPGSGGTYVYLRSVFGENSLGRALAFLFNWQFLLYAPCLLASGYIGFANYVAYLYPAAATNVWIHDAIAVAVGGVTIMALYRRTSRVAALGTVLAGFAVLTLVLVIAAAFAHGSTTAASAGAAHATGSSAHFSFALLAGFGGALIVTLYDYVGYADAALLGDEVLEANRTIPLAIVLSIVVVAALYVLLQIGVLGAIPWRSLLDAHGQPTAQSQYVGSLVVEHSWGRTAAIVVTLLVLITAFASLYGNLLGFSRIAFAAARDGAFLAPFARLHPRLDIPHVALLAVGGPSLLACFLTLDQVISVLTAGIVLIQGVAQIAALLVLRARREHAPFRMPLYPFPAFLALAGWVWAFVSTGTQAILLGTGWLVAGALVFLWLARVRRWWPFAISACVAIFCFVPVHAMAADGAWTTWQTSAIRQVDGYPEFTVDGKPFFVYGAAFFYARIPHERWHDAMAAYKRLGINTLDLYVPWNWHQSNATDSPDFTGKHYEGHDLGTVLSLARALRFKIILRPGPVIRNEWRNGGYPDWLLLQQPYNMPATDVYQGRYPATATLQNAHADAAGAEWLGNATHIRYAGAWLRDVLRFSAPWSHDIIAIALDDDQGAYIDNDTWPAPHWHAYVGWLRSTVQSVVGKRVPLFINTFESKVTAQAPAWAWGDWYQSDAYSIGTHDLAQLDFATGLLQTQLGVPHLYAEFQAGWLQGADEGAPRPSDPTTPALALHEVPRDGITGVVNFPVQDTIDPPGWEAPWANWSYAWDAALTTDLQPSARYAPTADFGNIVRAYGPLLASAHRVVDAAIVWPPAMFARKTLTNSDFRAFADATIAAQRDCSARRLTCDVVDLSVAKLEALARYRAVELPIVLDDRLRVAMTLRAKMSISRLRAAGKWSVPLGSISSSLDLPDAT
ncbi:MAG TPA: amino acid permease, partial [Candidatus Tumulicola sp.]